MNIVSPGGALYTVLKPLGGTKTFTLYACAYGDKEAILKIASTTAENAILDKEVFLLQTLQEEAAFTEEAYSKVKEGNQMMNYHFFFPQVVETFIDTNQKNRRVVILSFSQIASKLGDLVPMSHITKRDHVRVDPKTSVWMLGKLLKLLVFTHNLNISINLLRGENILIHREHHFVAIFDWSLARQGSVALTADVTAGEISQVTQQIIIALGGNPDTGEIPADDQLVDSRYTDFLKYLSSKKESNAENAHREFYKIVEALWPRSFYKYTTYNLV